MKIIKNHVITGKHSKPIVLDAFYTADKRVKPILIFCHGYKGFKDWGAWNIMAETFAKAGFCFIKFNFSHNGGTVEQPIDFPDLDAFGNNNYTKELDDLASVIDWVVQTDLLSGEIDINQIILLGHSRGGGIVSLKANEDKRVSSVISLAGVADFGKRTATIGDLIEWKNKGVKYVINGRTKQQMPHYYQFYENYIVNKERLNIKSAVSNLNIPHLIIHGDKDNAILINEAEQLHQWNSNSELFIIPNANHVFETAHPWTKKELSKELKLVCDKVVGFVNNLL